MSNWKANILTTTEPTSDGTNYTGKANGIWKSAYQIQQKKANLWAKGVLPPSAPTIGTITSSNQTLTVTFTPSATINGDVITGYTLQTTTGQSVSGSSSATSLSLTGLTNATLYTVYVVADSASGQSIPSASLTGTPAIQNVPSPPTLTNINAPTTSTIAVTINAPSSDGNSPITNYTVTRSPGNVSINSATPATVTFTGLTVFQSYTFTVTATNGIGTSNPSSPSVGVAPTPALGASVLGGYYAGKINYNGVIYALIVAPKASGEATGKAYQTSSEAIAGTHSEADGYANSVALVAAKGTGVPAASFCRGLTIGGYTDWYLPSYAETLVIYYSFKPTTTANNLTTNGAYPNPYAVAPQPVNINRTASDPAQTTISAFQNGSSEAFTSTLENGADDYWTSTQGPAPSWETSNAWFCWFGDGKTYFWNNNKSSFKRARAIRRVAVG